MKKEFTIKQTCETILNIEIVKQNDKYFAKVKRDYFITDEDEYECWIEDDGQLMTEPVSSDEEYDAIIETFCSYIKENGISYARICDKCCNGMNEGYIVGGGDEYYCSAECLHQVYTPKQWQDMYDESEENGGNDHYWTEWEGESCYILFDNQLISI
tara:strand:+ start:1249 stop:1719 length:471 start_codon:yes stop_codon:yes gene_type:complete